MARIIWSPRAMDDLERLIAYIAVEAPVTAKRFAKRIVQRVRGLSKHPLLGAVVIENESGQYREILQGNYRIIYRVDAKRVLIVTVRHAARLLSSDDFDE